jgi:hypothetical protein
MHRCAGSRADSLDGAAAVDGVPPQLQQFGERAQYLGIVIDEHHGKRAGQVWLR